MLNFLFAEEGESSLISYGVRILKSYVCRQFKLGREQTVSVLFVLGALHFFLGELVDSVKRLWRNVEEP